MSFDEPQSVSKCFIDQTYGARVSRKPMQDDKRRSKRLPLTAPISCLMTVAEAADHYAVVLNVSDEGVLIMSPSVVSTKPGDDVVLWLNKPERPRTMKVRAVVRWRERQEFGLEFRA